jgi:hypothetical protein
LFFSHIQRFGYINKIRIKHAEYTTTNNNLPNIQTDEKFVLLLFSAANAEVLFEDAVSIS